MLVEERPIDSIRPYENNPRRNDAGVEAVAKSLAAYGWRQPIVVDEAGVVIVGHTRLKAAKKLGMTMVPVHVATGLTAEQIHAYRIADNQTATLSEWDDDKLAIELLMLQEKGYDLDLTGFSADELLRLLDDGPKDGLTDPDDVPEPPDEAFTQPGDLWVLGNHRLLCGDSSKPEDVDRLLAGAGVHLVNTDPPYNVAVSPRTNNSIAGGTSTFTSGQRMHIQDADLWHHPEKAKPTHAKMRPKDRQLHNDALAPDEFVCLLKAWFGNIARVLLPGRAFYIWGGYSNCGNYPPVLKEAGLYFSQAIIWDKQYGVLSRKDFMGAHEWSFYGWREGAAHEFFGPHNVTDVWSVRKLHHASMEHLTQKPVELAAKAIEYSSRLGENVLDLFGGSGSTLIAAEQAKRNAYLMELDQAYCDVIVDRWQRFTGKAAILERTGEPFPKAPPAACEALR